MNSREAVALFALAQNYFPTLKANEYTPDAWADVLDDVPFDDARKALIELCKRAEPFTSVGEIRTEARRLRARRIEVDMPRLPPSDLDPDDPQAYIKWLAHARKAIADGEIQAGGQVIDMPHRDVPRAIEGTFRAVDDA